jgi:hypothetical protein
MGIDLLSPHWSKAQTIQWKEQTDPVMAGIALGLCVIAQILFCIFFVFVFSPSDFEAIFSVS